MFVESRESYVTLNLLYMWEKASEWKQLGDGYPFQLVRGSTTYEQTHLDFVNQHRFHIRKEQILLFKNWLYRDEIQSANEFHWTLTLLTAKIFRAELARVVYSKKKFTVIIFRNVVTECHGVSGKWKFERTVTLKGRWLKTNVYPIKYADWYR